MDTSKEYIEMSRALPDEIIKEREWELYDTVYLEDLKAKRTVTLKYHFSHIVPDYNNVWLPRQDQLQDMLKEIFFDAIPRKFVYELWDWVAKTSPKYDDSMEQLWLAFIMYKKYNKVWNGEKWVNKDEQ